MKTCYRILVSGPYCIALLLGISAPLSADQLVTPTQSRLFSVPGAVISITGAYAVTAPSTANETGLGLRLHYNSQQLSPASQTLYANGKQPVSDPTDDTDNADNDSLTDKFIVLGWLDNDAQWPGSASLENLFTANFTTLAGLTSSSYVRLTASSTAKDTTFQTSPVMICAKPTLTVTADPLSITEGDTTSVAFRISSDITLPVGCGAVPVQYRLSGSATPDTDYQLGSQTVQLSEGSNQVLLPVTVINDALVEADETLTLTLTPGSNYQTGGSNTATLIIHSEDVTPVLPEVNLSISKTNATEGSSGSILLYASRKSDNLSAALEVFLNFSGTLDIGTDTLAFPASITIPAGQTQAFKVLVIKDDADNESEEQLNISIAANPNYRTGTSASLQLLIQDDENNQYTNLPLPTSATPITAHTGIPTLGEWMLLLLSLLLAAPAVLHLRIAEPGKR